MIYYNFMLIVAPVDRNEYNDSSTAGTYKELYARVLFNAYRRLRVFPCATSGTPCKIHACVTRRDAGGFANLSARLNAARDIISTTTRIARKIAHLSATREPSRYASGFRR